MNIAPPHPLLRHRDGNHARVTNEELFFDLAYVFAVTQLSHTLLHHLSAAGALETLILWFAVWLGWQYTCWVTNWFDPEQPRIRLMLFATMAIALVMAAAIPDSFGNRGLVFAGCYVAMQIGRTAFIVSELGGHHPLAANYRRILAWLVVSGCCWVAGGMADHGSRIILWSIAVGCEYTAPMFGFPVPGLGRSRTSDWNIEGGHLAERCQLFVIVALGESLLATGATLSEMEIWASSTFYAVAMTFIGTLTMWWLYFGTSSKDATMRIKGSEDPGRIGALFHYVHAILVAGIIVGAVGNDLAMDHSIDHATPFEILTVTMGPVIFLLGSAVYKHIVYGRLPITHLVGVAILVVTAWFGIGANLLVIGSFTAFALLGVGILDRLTQSSAVTSVSGAIQ